MPRCSVVFSIVIILLHVYGNSSIFLSRDSSGMSQCIAWAPKQIMDYVGGSFSMNIFVVESISVTDIVSYVCLYEFIDFWEVPGSASGSPGGIQIVSRGSPGGPPGLLGGLGRSRRLAGAQG